MNFLKWITGMMLTAVVISAWSAPTVWAAEGEKVLTDKLGKTIETYDRDGRLVRSVRQDLYGPKLGRETTTTYSYNDRGRKASRVIVNGLMRRVEYYGPKGTVERGEQEDRFGLGWEREKKITNYEYDAKGQLVSNIVTSKLETVTNHFDAHGQVVESRRQRNVGLGATRDTAIHTVYQAETGLPVKRVEENAYGRTETTAFDPETLMPAEQQAKYNYGLGSTRETSIRYEWNLRNGLPIRKTETNRYGVTRIEFDAAKQGTYGVPATSVVDAKFGLATTRHTEITWKTDTLTGLPTHAKAVNKYATTETFYDTVEGGLAGVETRIVTRKNFGISGKRYSVTNVEVNPFNGLRKKATERFVQPPEEQNGKAKTRAKTRRKK